MTHSLHRRGSRKSLMDDWIIFSYSNEGQTLENNKKLVKLYTKYKPVCCDVYQNLNGKWKIYRYMKGWNKHQNSGVHEAVSIEELNKIQDPWGCEAVFDDRESVQNLIIELGEADLGNCTVLSGIFDEVFEMLSYSKIAYPHTVNMSGGVFGRVDLLPEPKILEITSMCGHHFVSPVLVMHLIERVKNGSLHAKEAAVELGKQCTCNFFNVVRAERLIQEYIIGRG